MKSEKQYRLAVIFEEDLPMKLVSRSLLLAHDSSMEVNAESETDCYDQPTTRNHQLATKCELQGEIAMALQMQEETREIISSDGMSGNGQIESTIAGASAASGSDVDHGDNTGEASRRDEGIYTEAGTSPGKIRPQSRKNLSPHAVICF